MSEEAREKFGLNSREMLKKIMERVDDYSEADSMDSMAVKWRYGDLVVVIDQNDSKTVYTCDSDGCLNRVWICPEVWKMIVK